MAEQRRNSSPDSPPPPTIELGELSVASVLGRGGNGIVFLVRHLPSGETLALKSMPKPSTDADLRRICFERDALLALRHPLLPSLRGTLSTETLLAFAIDFCPGGDLNSVRRRQTEKTFSPEVIRFYAAELVIALKHLHGLGMIYRDLKPENVLIQENGHIMLLDFDLSTRIPAPGIGSPQKAPELETKRSERGSLFRCFSRRAGVSPDLAAGETPPPHHQAAKSKSFVGTEEYVAPEIIDGRGHDFAVDWWCLGVVLYEMLYGRTPFRGQNRKETFRRILTRSPELVGEPTALRDLIGRMLVKDPAKRIAGEEIRRHEFFRGVDWDSVVGIARPPLIPMGEEWEEGVQGLDVEKIVEGGFGKGKGKGSGGTRLRRSCSGNGDFTVF